jgi:hypothetical protein
VYCQVIIGGPKTVFRNMQVADPKLSFMEKAKTVNKTHLAFPDRFHLCSCQYNARIVFVFDEIIVIGRAILDGHDGLIKSGKFTDIKMNERYWMGERITKSAIKAYQ